MDESRSEEYTDILSVLENTYCFYKNGDKNKKKFVFECRKSDKNLSELFKSDTFVELIENEDKTIFLFDVNDIKTTYEHFINGKYSKISEDDKSIILDFVYNHFDKKVFKKTSEILYKKDELRKELEKNLNMSLPEGIELSSKIEIDTETFNLDDLQ